MSPQLQPHLAFYVTPSFSDQLVSVVGAIGHTSDTDVANMVWETCAVHDVTVVAAPGQSAVASQMDKDKPKPSGASSGPLGTEFTIAVPVLVNKGKMQAGDELFVFRPEQKRKAAPILMSSVVEKRARSGQ